MVSLEMLSCRMGALEALERRMEGGVMPVGSECSTACEAAANCATAASTLALGWKNILMMDRPGSDWDSMCSMSLTEVVKERSQRMVTTSAISSGEMPPYDQMTLTTGISISGKMSVGMRKVASTPRMTIIMDMTTKV